MKIPITETREFTKDIGDFIGDKKLLSKDFDDFKENLSDNPKAGDVISGTGGVRKIRIKSASKGKSGGFRICYYYYQENVHIFLITIYQKSTQENLTADQKKRLKNLVAVIKGK